MATTSRTHFAILGFLTHGPMSGYDIKKLVAESTENFWSESFGTIYPALRELAKQGLVEKSDAPSEGGRARHVYSITGPGREVLATWLREPTPPPPVRDELLLKLFFGACSDRSTNRAQILAYRDRRARDLERYRAIAERLQRERADASDLPYWLLTLRSGEHVHEAYIAWCDEALAVLEDIPDPGQPAKKKGKRK